jgi:hypothetical protein
VVPSGGDFPEKNMGFVVDFQVPALENMTQTKTRVYGLNVSTLRRVTSCDFPQLSYIVVPQFDS